MADPAAGMAPTNTPISEPRMQIGHNRFIPHEIEQGLTTNTPDPNFDRR